MPKHLKRVAALTALTALLAACQQTTAPHPQAALVKVNLSAATLRQTQGMHALGFTSDVPNAHYDVTIRDNAGHIVAFNGTTFDPTGNGATTLTLGQANEFTQTLLLPKGTYSFETKVKDDATSAVLLGYGPSTENQASVDATGSVIRLKSHAVFQGASSALAPAMNLAELYTDSTFNLSLNLKTAPVQGLSATVPTSDIGPVTYSLGNSTDGVLNGAGSKIGVNVTARGTASDAELNVTANFSAWVYNGATDTASVQPVSLSFAKTIQTNMMTIDTVMPSVTFAPVGTAYTNQATLLTGRVTDDVQVQNLRVYVDGNLVASTDSAEQVPGVAPVITDGTGAWTAPWGATNVGTADVTVIGEDSSGNETRLSQSVTVEKQSAIEITPEDYGNYYQAFDVMNGVPLTFKVNADANQGMLHFKVYGYATVTATDPSGTPLAIATQYTGYTDFYGFPSGQYTFTVTPTQDQTLNIETHYD
ncbi:hypothetical protein E7T09_20385 [Deinococcus sp. KSM4-11]|uniref:hypothetical protein n=1 Tax=Deinococcus sp. KSM4-11 TaxID=2568654 RepID=UPI0010A515FC|nr:hypothetical protein [Deinococcus sp. KSM4-11]THF84365.1 hypothetical protein E7T09_20385 [Deinococcus sp. KSM4-11]